MHVLQPVTCLRSYNPLGSLAVELNHSYVRLFIRETCPKPRDWGVADAGCLHGAAAQVEGAYDVTTDVDHVVVTHGLHVVDSAGDG